MKRFDGEKCYALEGCRLNAITAVSAALSHREPMSPDERRNLANLIDFALTDVVELARPIFDHR